MNSRSFEENHSDGICLIDLDKFVKIKKIGTGAISKVYTVKEKATNKIYATKVYNINLDNFNFVYSFYREIEAMSIFNSPFIVKYFGCHLERELAIIMEYVPNGTLENLLRHGPAPKSGMEQESSFLFTQLH